MITKQQIRKIKHLYNTGLANAEKFTYGLNSTMMNGTDFTQHDMRHMAIALQELYRTVLRTMKVLKKIEADNV